ncbi:hypothetical protein BGX26_003323 [Mortierella sp. AD094]|nr:hypothetical protein BGX26_003323 [Mortierella sp. AD094]
MFKKITSESEFAKAINSESISIVHFNKTDSQYQVPDYKELLKDPVYAEVKFYLIAIEDLYELSKREIEIRLDDYLIVYKNGRKIDMLDVLAIQLLHGDLEKAIEMSGFERQVKKFNSVQDFNAAVDSGRFFIVCFMSTWRDHNYSKYHYEKMANDPAFSGVEFYVASSGDQKDIAAKAQVDGSSEYQVYKNGFRFVWGYFTPESMQENLMKVTRGADIFGCSSEITADIKSGRVVVVHFKEKDSYECEFLSHELEKVKKLPELSNIGFCDVDINDEEEIAKAFEIKIMPIVFIYKYGLKTSRIVGQDVQDIHKMILKAATSENLNNM